MATGLITKVPSDPCAIRMPIFGKIAQIVRKTKADTGGITGGTYRTAVEGTDRQAHAKFGSCSGCHIARGDAVTKLGAIITRLPAHELAIRRLSAIDASFLSACEDFEAGAAAMQLWANAGPGYTARTQEYRDLLAELEAEILTDLATHLQHIPGSDTDVTADHAFDLPRHSKN
ncbi:hypothetical protein [Pseudoruegeria sp. SK021]|uniref:hypothetical protein n=1 Tax=Pseudoruegeria sp. SK021 TaxID=1933035 RepID=UPI000A2392C3|nr:hypothetical protein [Pseudoruegeria sp. SK021]OSP53949.1 hypothetical protein BV911_15225 [Pseudoruegeria sp. SK021]